MIAALLALVLGCGVDRSDVKNMSDSDAAKVHVAEGHTTVEDLVKIPAPAQWGNFLPRLPGELTAVRIEADILGAKREADGDYHVVIAGITGQTMIIELPDPACARASVVLPLIEQMRAKIEVVLGRAPTASYRKLKVPIHVRLTGVVFFDRAHGQTGAAPNAIELHPILAIEAMP